MPYSEVFWTKFLGVFASVIGAVLGLLPVLLLALGTIGVALHLHHQRMMVRLQGAREALGLPDHPYTSPQREALRYLETGR